MSSPQSTAVSSAAAAQAAQAGLAVLVGRDVDAAFAHLDVGNLRKSLPDFSALIAAITHRYGPASATLAARSYKADRAAAGVTAAYTVVVAPSPDLSQIGQTVDWATQPLWQTEPDLTQARANVSAATERLVLDIGRNTITANAAKDPKARGWARVPEPHCCAFCALLATRGAIYTGETGAFKTHDNCRCHVEPIFGHYEPSAQIRAWQALYRDSTTGGNAARARRQWRKAFDAQNGTT